MERSVEAGDGRHLGEQAADQLQTSQGLGLVQRGEVGERLQPAQHPGVDQHRLGELGAAMDDSVAHRVDRPAARDRLSECALIQPSGRGRDVLGEERPVAAGEHRELEAARAGVDDEDPHRRQTDQVQLLMSGGSSPSCRV